MFQLTVAGHSAKTQSFSPELLDSHVLVLFMLGILGCRCQGLGRGGWMVKPAYVAASALDTRPAMFCWAVFFQSLSLVQAGHLQRDPGHASLCGSFSLGHEASQVLLGSTFPVLRSVVCTPFLQGSIFPVGANTALSLAPNFKTSRDVKALTFLSTTKKGQLLPLIKNSFNSFL